MIHLRDFLLTVELGKIVESPPFLSLLVVELLSLNIQNNPDIEGLSIFDREIRISELALSLPIKDNVKFLGIHIFKK